MQGAVTLVTMAIPIIFSLLALVRVEHYRSTQHDKLHHDREVVSQQTTLLDEGQTLSIPQESLQASYHLPSSSFLHAFRIQGSGASRQHFNSPLNHSLYMACMVCQETCTYKICEEHDQ